MKPSTSQLRDLLASRQFYTAPLLTFVLQSGTTLRYGGGDADINANGHAYSCGGQTGPFFFKQGSYPQCVTKIGTQVSTLQFDVQPGAAVVGGVPFMAAIRAGRFDQADFTYERAIMPTYGDTSAGTVIMFSGLVADINVGRSLATFIINSYMDLLTRQFPRNLYQAGCVNTLYDASCALNPATFAVNGTATGAGAKTVTTASGLGAAGYLDLGKIVMTSGANNGLARPIRTWDGAGTIILGAPFPTLPAAGDTFTVYPGCDKTKTMCVAKFNNFVNFRGFPDVPAVETSI